MMKLMDKMILSCKQATFYCSVKNFKKIGWLKKIQLKIHLKMCRDCFLFNQQSELIDKTIEKFNTTCPNSNTPNLTPEKKSNLKATVNKGIS